MYNLTEKIRKSPLFERNNFFIIYHISGNISPTETYYASNWSLKKFNSTIWTSILLYNSPFLLQGQRNMGPFYLLRLYMQLHVITCNFVQLCIVACNLASLRSWILLILVVSILVWLITFEPLRVEQSYAVRLNIY